MLVQPVNAQQSRKPLQGSNTPLDDSIQQLFSQELIQNFKADAVSHATPPFKKSDICATSCFTTSSLQSNLIENIYFSR